MYKSTTDIVFSYNLHNFIDFPWFKTFWYTTALPKIENLTAARNRKFRGTVCLVWIIRHYALFTNVRTGTIILVAFHTTEFCREASRVKHPSFCELPWIAEYKYFAGCGALIHGPPLSSLRKIGGRPGRPPRNVTTSWPIIPRRL